MVLGKECVWFLGWVRVRVAFEFGFGVGHGLGFEVGHELMFTVGHNVMFRGLGMAWFSVSGWP